MRNIRAEITIQANIHTVWNILEDFENYNTWNLFCPKIETTKKIGDPFIMTVYLTRGRKPIIQKEIFSDYEPPHKVGWRLNWGIWLKTHRIQVLTAIDEHTTHYFTEDKFWGILTPLVIWLYGTDIQQGFDFVASALKEAAENTLN